MTYFEEMKALFEKMGLEIRVTSGKFIDVIDNERNNAEFSFNPNGSFSKSGYYVRPEKD